MVTQKQMQEFVDSAGWVRCEHPMVLDSSPKIDRETVFYRPRRWSGWPFPLSEAYRLLAPILKETE